MDKIEFQKVIEAVKLREVFLEETHNTLHVHHSQVNPQHTDLILKKNKAKYHIIPKKSNKEGAIFSKIVFMIEGVSQKDIIGKDNQVIKKKGEALFTISASYVVTYTVNNLNLLNKEAIEYFGTQNAYFNVYPYLREFITNISQRMNLNPVVIPLLKLNKQLVQSKEKK